MKDSNDGEEEYSWEEDSATCDVISIMIALAIVRVVSDNHDGISCVVFVVSFIFWKI